MILSILLCSVFLLGGCAHTIWEKDRGLGPLDPSKGAALSVDYGEKPDLDKNKLEIPTLIYHFLTLKKAANEPDPSVETLSQYVDVGITLSNKACASWFALHNAEHDKVQYQQGLINLVGNTLNAALGVSDSNINLMGYTSLLLGGVNAGYELFKSDFFLTGTIWQLEKQVRTARTTLAETLKQNVSNKNDPYTYFETENALLQYHNTCSRLQLLSYVEKSVELARIAPPDTKQIEVEKELREIGKDLYKIAYDEIGVFSKDQLGKLYVLFYLPGTSWGKELKETGGYLADVKERVDALGAKKKEKAAAPAEGNKDEAAQEQEQKKKDEEEQAVLKNNKKAAEFHAKLARAGDLLKMDEVAASHDENLANAKDEVKKAEDAVKDAGGKGQPSGAGAETEGTPSGETPPASGEMRTESVVDLTPESVFGLPSYSITAVQQEALQKLKEARDSLAEIQNTPISGQTGTDGRAPITLEVTPGGSD